MNQYRGFFNTSLHAHFTALIVSLHSLYENRRDTLSISKLLKTLGEKNKIQNSALDKANMLYTEAKPLWLKVCILRNNVFGHRSDSKTIEEIFKEADITPGQLKRLIGLAKRLLNIVSHALDGSFHAFNLSTTDTTLKVLQNLKESANLRPKYCAPNLHHA
jgi:hypothetical protein